MILVDKMTVLTGCSLRTCTQNSSVKDLLSTELHI